MSTEPLSDKVYGKALPWSQARQLPEYPMRYAPAAYAEPLILLLAEPPDPSTGPDERRGQVRWMDRAGILLVPTTALDQLQKWDGRITVVGYIDRLHVHRIDDEDILIAEVIGQAVPIGYHTLPTRQDLRSGFLSIPRDRAMVGEEYVFPFLLDPDSSFAMLAQDALVSGLAVDMSGRLANGDEPGVPLCGLPLIPDALTVFSAG